MRLFVVASAAYKTGVGKVSRVGHQPFMGLCLVGSVFTTTMTAGAGETMVCADFLGMGMAFNTG
jgi:hypothetical protein